MQTQKKDLSSCPLHSKVPLLSSLTNLSGGKSFSDKPFYKPLKSVGRRGRKIQRIFQTTDL